MNLSRETLRVENYNKGNYLEQKRQTKITTKSLILAQDER